MSSTRRPVTLTLAHSPDPDDVFMWWPLTGMVDPGDPARVVSPPPEDLRRELDALGWSFRAVPADIAELNRLAIRSLDEPAASYDITALSMFTYAHVQRDFVLTSCGASVGLDYGPKLVALPLPGLLAPPGADAPAHAPSAEAIRSLIARGGGAIAVPGVQTTAFACLCMLMGWKSADDWRGRVVEMPFDAILRAVETGRGPGGGGEGGGGPRISAGLLIHQSQLTYTQHGLVELVDFGRVWKEATGLPLPLGGNALRRDLETRLGPGSLQRLTDLLDRSVRFALKHREESTRYAMKFAPEIDRAQADRYIDMYVSDYTLNLGEKGARAVERLIGHAASLGLCPALGCGRQHIVWAATGARQNASPGARVE